MREMMLVMLLYHDTRSSAAVKPYLRNLIGFLMGKDSTKIRIYLEGISTVNGNAVDP